MKLTIVVPVYNEEHRLERNMLQTIEYLENQAYDHELIIVDDGSTDGTRAIAERLAAAYSDTVVLGYAHNRGKGYAVKTGIGAGTGDYLFFIDADGSTPISFIADLLNRLEQGKADMVVGSRNLVESNRTVPQPIWRQWLGRLGNIIIRYALRLSVRDTQCGFKGFTKKAARDIFSAARIPRWGFDFELLVIAHERNFRVEEIPVTWSDSDGSRFKLIGGSISTLYELCKVLVRMWSGAYRYKKIDK